MWGEGGRQGRKMIVRKIARRREEETLRATLSPLLIKTDKVAASCFKQPYHDTSYDKILYYDSL